MFKGIITPIVTPFNKDVKQTINYKETERLINYLIDHGVSGIFILGSNGEFHVIDKQEKKEFMKEVVRIVNHRVPLFVGTGSCSTNEAIELAQYAEKVGVDALSVITPYFMKNNNIEVSNYFRDIANSVDLPIILYNIPKLTGINIDGEVIENLRHVDNIKGIKDSSGDMNNLKVYIDCAKDQDFSVLVGSDSKISEAYKLGATGAIAGTSNVIVDTVVGLDANFRNGKFDEAEKLQNDIDVLRNVLPLGTVPSIMKRAVTLAGIADVGYARKPVVETSVEDDLKIKEMLEYYKLI